MPTFKVRVQDFGPAMARLAESQKAAALKGMQVAVHLHAPRVVNEEIDKTIPKPVDVGTYRRSWEVRDRRDGVALFNHSLHASIIETGRRPGARMPPPKAIAEWVYRKGLVGKGADGLAAAKKVGFLVARKIQLKGLEGKHILSRSAARLHPIVREAILEAVSKATP